MVKKCLCALGFLAMAGALANPRIPPSPDVILEHVPAAEATSRLEPLRAKLAAHPTDLTTALALARGYLEIGRANADPRFVSYSEATLAPWLSQAQPNPAVLTIAASCAQYLHRFDDALALLNRSLKIQPYNAEARLTQATVLQVQGQFDAARQACRPLIQQSGQIIALACLTSVNSLTGELQQSYRSLRQVYIDDPSLEPAVRIWILNTLADMAVRLGDEAAAEVHLTNALKVNASDGYTKGEYADLLLRQQRYNEVITLLKADEQQDNLLLRLAIAATRLHLPQAAALSNMFQARYEAARRDGDFTHLREQARFALEVRHDAAGALTLARRNWATQREPADVRIYSASITATGDAPARRELTEWLDRTHYQDATLTTTNTRLAAAR
jgi:tetratricopeptide (TPR) repeat protein